ncbi:MAG: hypothetical protein K2G63_04925 [Oscillospiraceae bacterium]|nr:hypothetical protein [Oscillospiraceae bacterium]
MNYFEHINSLPIKINIGDYYFFADSVKISGNSILNEQATVSGSTVITNSTIKNTLVTLKGSLASDSDFTSFVLYAENIFRNKISVDFTYKNIAFNLCTLKSYSSENKNDDINIINIMLTFSVSELKEVSIEYEN